MAIVNIVFDANKEVDDILNGVFKTAEELNAHLETLESYKHVAVHKICERLVFRNNAQELLTFAENTNVFDQIDRRAIPVLFYHAASNDLQYSLAFLCEKFPGFVNDGISNISAPVVFGSLFVQRHVGASTVLLEHGCSFSVFDYLCARQMRPSLLIWPGGLELLARYKGMSCIDVCTKDHRTPLWAAISSHCDDSVRLLCALGCTQHPRKRRKIPKSVQLPDEEETLQIRYRCFFDMSACHRLLIALEELHVERHMQARKRPLIKI